MRLTELEIWLQDWRIVINVDKSAAVLFTTRCIPTPRLLRFLEDKIQWVEKVKYLEVTLDKRLTWATQIDQVRRKASQRLGVLGALLNRRSGLSIRNGLMLYKQLICPMMDYACPVWRDAAKFFSPSASVYLRALLGTSAICNFTRTWRFPI